MDKRLHRQLHLLLGLLWAMVLVVPAAEAPSWSIANVAGSNFSGDGGPAVDAPIGRVEALVYDRAGNLLLADAAGHRVRRISPDGIISTVVGTGAAESSGDGGPAISAGINTPSGLALDALGNLYVSDAASNRVRMITPDGRIATIAGNGGPGYGGDGRSAPATPVGSPRAIALDSSGSLLIAMAALDRVIRVTPAGITETVAGTGVFGWSGDGGPATAATVGTPTGLAVGPDGTIYVAERGNHVLRRVRGGVISTVLGTGSAGSGPRQLNGPVAVLASSSGSIWIADRGNQRLVRLDPGGAVSALPNAGWGLALDPGGRLVFGGVEFLQRVEAGGGVSTLAGTGDFAANGDGRLAGQARVSWPAMATLDASGRLVFTETYEGRVRRVQPSGKIETVAAGLQQPAGIAADSSGNLYVAERSASRVVRISASGGITLVAGKNTAGYTGDGGPAASALLNNPTGLAFDSWGSLYIADTGNHAIRRVANDVISTVAGGDGVGYGGDGGAAVRARLSSPWAVSADKGWIWISDNGNHRVRRVTPSGIIETVCGTGQPGSLLGASATASQLTFPRGISLDRSPGGDGLWIADTGNNRILRLSSAGMLSVAAGTGNRGVSGDNGPALQAELSYPTDVLSSPSGMVYITIPDSDRVRVLLPPQQTTTPPPAPVSDPVVQPPPLTAVHAATFRQGPVAPGQLLTLYWAGGGEPAQNGVPGSGGAYPLQLGNTRVLFDGRPAPLFFAGGNQVNVQAPYAIQGQPRTAVEIWVADRLRAASVLDVTAASPGLFSGANGAAAALNERGAVNSESNPAERGSVVVLFGTGEGSVAPAAVEGAVAQAPYPAPILPLSVTIAGRPAEILYAGAAPGMAGVFQVNARIPSVFMPAGILPVIVRVGTAMSPDGVTLAVK